MPGLLGTTLESIPLEIPYVHPDPGLVEHWSRELAATPGFKVGINWQGNPTFAGHYHRSMPLRHFEAPVRVPGVQLFSLQKNEGAEQFQELGDAFPVVDLGARLDEANGPFMDTAAVLKNLDRNGGMVARHLKKANWDIWISRQGREPTIHLR